MSATTTEAAAQLAPGEGNEFLDRVRNCADWDEAGVKVLKEHGTSRSVRGEERSEEDGLIFHHNKVYIPLDPMLQHDIVKAHHDTPLTGHPGHWRTTELIS